MILPESKRSILTHRMHDQTHHDEFETSSESEINLPNAERREHQNRQKVEQSEDEDEQIEEVGEGINPTNRVSYVDGFSLLAYTSADSAVLEHLHYNYLMAVSLASNDLYGGVVLTGFLMAMEYLMTMEITCIINRRRHFSQQFLKEHFGEEHMNAFGH